jgi:Sec-independent protein translocase protein TatA
VTLAFLNLGGSELLVFGVIALLVFGDKLPDVMRNLGKAYVKLRHGLTEASRPVREEMARIEREAMRPEPPAPSSSPHAHPPVDAQSPYPTNAPPPPPPAPSIDEPPPV